MLKSASLILSLVLTTNVYSFEINATSSLKPQNKIKYSSGNLLDKNSETAWCARLGGEDLILSVKGNPGNGRKVGIFNGYAKNKKKFEENARIKDVTITTNSANVDVTLKDSAAFQVVEVGDLANLSITIKSYYPGSKFNDVCLNEIVIDQNILSGLEKLSSLQHRGRALTSKEIKSEIGPIFGKYKDNLHSLIELMLSAKDESALRLLLDILHYHDKYETTIYAELSEGLNGMIEGYFTDSDDILINVLKDAKQENRKAIAEYFQVYLGMIDTDLDSPKADNSKQRVRLKELNKLINKYSKAL